MSNNSGTKLPLNIVINKEKTKVLFAEANSDFINVLLSFLTLPLGKVVKKGIPLGSITALYAAIGCLDDTYFCVRGAKEMLLNPESSFRAECRKLALDVTDSGPNRCFLCEDLGCPRNVGLNISMYSDVAACDCGRSLNRAVTVGEHPGIGVFTISPLSFVVTDDLRVAPIVSGTVQTLLDLGIADTQGADVMTLNFDVTEVCLTSATPLTDMILKKTGESFISAAKPELPRILPRNIEEGDANTRKMALRVCLQKSTNKFLFAEAMDDFVEFLFSFSTLPLAGVEFLLGGNTGLESIGNLYRSVANGIDVKYFTTPDIRNRLINPKIAYGYGSENQFLPLSEDSPPKLYYKTWYNFPMLRHESCIHVQETGKVPVSSFKSSKTTYVKKMTMCFLKEDLTLFPSLATNISILSSLGVPLSDVKEMEFHIGMEEALSTLKASLTSKTALTDALTMLKLEH